MPLLVALMGFDEGVWKEFLRGFAGFDANLNVEGLPRGTVGKGNGVFSTSSD